jgi:hypothetical protein
LFKDKVLLSWDVWIALATGLAAYFVVAEDAAGSVLQRLAGSGVAVSSALVGVVIAALAVIVAFLDDEFAALIDSATEDGYGGMEGQLFPFWFVTGLGVFTILTSVAVTAFASNPNAIIARVLVGVLSFLLVWTALGVFNIVAYLHATGVSKALWISRRSKGRRPQGRRDEK